MDPSSQQPSSPSLLSAKERRRARGRFSNISSASVVEPTHIVETTDDEEEQNVDRLSVGDGDIVVGGEEYEVPEEDLEAFDEKIAKIAPRIPDLELVDEEEKNEAREEAGDHHSSDSESEHNESEHEELRDIPMEGDKNVDASVLSDLEVVRGQMTSLQAQISARDNRIATLEGEIKRLNLAIQNLNPSESSNIMDVVGALRQDVQTIRAEMTGWQERRQEELQLSEQKMRKDLAKSAPAPIIAASTDVPDALVTPGTASNLVPSAPVSKPIAPKRKKAVRYE